MSKTDNSPRTYPVLGMCLIVVGIGFLALSAFGNVRFGWSLSHDPIDQYWLALIYGGSDLAAGVMVAAGASMLAVKNRGWGWKAGGLAALVPALILLGLSVLSTFGMMSGRIATPAGHNAALKVDAGRVATMGQGSTFWMELPVRAAAAGAP